MLRLKNVSTRSFSARSRRRISLRRSKYARNRNIARSCTLCCTLMRELQARATHTHTARCEPAAQALPSLQPSLSRVPPHAFGATRERWLFCNSEGRAHARLGVVARAAHTDCDFAQGIDRERFALGSLSHIVNHNAFGYEPLPDFAEEVRIMLSSGH